MDRVYRPTGQERVEANWLWHENLEVHMGDLISLTRCSSLLSALAEVASRPTPFFAQGRVMV